jgi:hypothetical protein
MGYVSAWRRFLGVSVGFLAFVLMHGSASATSKLWNTGAGTWSENGLWTPTGMPTSADTAFLGFAQTAHDATVSLDVNPTLSGLYVSDGIILEARTKQITVNGDTTISGDNGPSGGYPSRLSMWHNLLNPYDLNTTNLDVSFGGSMFLDGTVTNVLGQMVVDGASSVDGQGVFNFYTNSGPALVLDGTLNPGSYGTGPYSFTLNQLGTGRFDLDGGVADDSAIDVAAYVGSFTVNGDQLSDTFDDTIYVGQGSSMNMNLTNGWTMGSSAWLAFVDYGRPGDCVLGGSGTLTLNGTFTFVNPGDTHARIDAPLVVNNGLVSVYEYKTITFKNKVTMTGGRINVYQSGTAQFDGPLVMNSGSVDLKDWWAQANFNGAATFNGGHVIASDLSDVQFNGTTTINAGTFDAIFRGDINFNGTTRVFGGIFNGVPTYGGMYFNGPTEYANSITMTGEVQQTGTATVNNPATINAEIFDMDGKFAVTTWNIYAPLTVNADKINLSSNTFTGTMNLISTVSSAAQAHINLPAGAEWTMAGALNMTGSGFGTASDVIAGSDVNISGPVKVSFDNAISARADFTSFNVSTINASSSLRLDGGNLINVNTIAGATIQGPGTLKSSTNHALWGHGTINAAIGFGGGELRADGGTLNVNGPVSSVGIIGAQQNATLKFGSAFNTSVATKLELNGGTVSGSIVTNTKETHGYGTINTSVFVNNGSITVGSGTLLLNTTQAPDLDGNAETGKLLVSGGTLHVVDAPGDDFNGLAAVGASGVLRLDQGWTVGSGGFLSMSGSNATPSMVVASGQTITGSVTLPSNSRGKFDAKTTFGATANTTINTGSQLELLQDGTVTQGASFGGGGTLRNNAGAKLTLMHNANVATRLENSGSLQFGPLFSAVTSADSFNQTSTGLAQFDVMGASPGTGFDRLNITGQASLSGVLALNNGFYNPAYLVGHEIIHAGGGVSGHFVAVTGFMLSPTKYLAVIYQPNGVEVTAAIPGDANLDGEVNVADLGIVATNWQTPGIWTSGDFDQNLQVDVVDLGLLATNWQVGVGNSPGSQSFGDALASLGLPHTSVPEPGAAALLLVPSMLLLRRARNG